MKERDPVCFKILEIENKARHEKYKARDFYFCSDECQDKFESKPDIYYTIAL